MAVLAYATLLALLLPGQGNCFAPSEISTSIVGSKAPTSMGPIATQKQIKAIAKTTHLHMVGDNSELQGTDRVLSCLPYLIPLLDGERYGRFLFYLIPALGYADIFLLGPFKLIYGAIPFSQFIAFIGLSTLSRNPELPRAVRFNMQQALLLDIALIFPSLLGQLAGQIRLPDILATSGSNAVYLAMILSVGYSIASNATGKVPDKIPVISEAAGASVGPY